MLLSDATSVAQFFFQDHLPLTAALLLGLAAAYFLLPRPGSTPWAGYLTLAVLGVGTAITFFSRRESFSADRFVERLLFFSFSALAIVGGSWLLSQRNPARAALAFALVVLSTCGIFLLLAAPFLMAATIIIYAGAIIVTFLFVLMLARQEGPSDADQRSREPLLASVAGFVLLGALLYCLYTTFDSSGLDPYLERVRAARRASDAEEMALALGKDDKTMNEFFTGFSATIRAGERNSVTVTMASQVTDLAFKWGAATQTRDLDEMRSILAELESVGALAKATYGQSQPQLAQSSTRLSNFSGPAANEPRDQIRRDASGTPAMPAENAAYLGQSLFTDYLLAVELGGVLLLVAMIGAIAIAHRRAGRAA